ncbi:hypothetical protein BCIN_07g03860 [Botrytis cinerea B05.10]|uniref:Uncharacterized protein n=1 Tax=Botryotinia fuckeliana (strain B05.10) TaxID=332648 RepID=A0A384JMK2_BOTFB|nr:hypothetical protein BCIN_07g03860 [Botrytis cinerea B05.10]ATZ51819.1 hypothetical protein BCIN_07g03860 [Botrytis cinerea B05.10]
MEPVQFYLNYIFLSSSSLLFDSSSLSNSTATDECKEIEDIVCNRRLYLIGMMILFSINFILSTMRLFSRIHDNRQQTVRRDVAAEIPDLREEIRSNKLKEKSSSELHLRVFERIT